MGTNFQERLKKIVICCGGAIGVIDIPRLVLTLRRAYGSDIYVTMSKAATAFVTPFCLEICSGNPVLTDLERFKLAGVSPHLWVTHGASVCLVAPATANLIGKMAASICDDAISTCLQAVDCPVLVAPSMNASMWRKPILQDKVTYLRKAGIQFIEPSVGLEVATMSDSDSSMPSIDRLIEAIVSLV